ncbi:Vacuolar protein sorting-associated protein ist1 [Savitreella phatthalungensis]
MPSPETTKLKVHLKLSITRLRNLQQKKVAVAKQQRRDLAAVMAQGKEQSARIRVENIIREDINVELLEILELYCELLLARIGLLDSRECDPGLEEAVKSLIYAAPRSEVKELQVLRAMFLHKYGKAFEQDAADNKDDKVNAKVVLKLGVTPPSEALVDRYLKEIARTYHVAWQGGEEDSDGEDEVSTHGHGGAGGGGGSGGGVGVPEVDADLPNTPAKDPLQIVNVALPSPTTENPRPRLHIPHEAIKNKGAALSGDPPRPKPEVAAAAAKNGSEDDNSFEAIMARFEKLKRG